MVTYCPKCRHEMEMCFSGASCYVRCLGSNGCGSAFKVTEVSIKELLDGGEYMISVEDN